VFAPSFVLVLLVSAPMILTILAHAHLLIYIQTRAGALTNLLPWQGGLPKGDVAEKWQM
jgi:hypothetical protein